MAQRTSSDAWHAFLVGRTRRKRRTTGAVNERTLMSAAVASYSSGTVAVAVAVAVDLNLGFLFVILT